MAASPDTRPTLWVSGDVLGVLFGGISGRRVRDLSSEGVIPTPKVGKWDAIVCVPAYYAWKHRSAAAGDLDPAQERARKEKELADNTALKNAQLRNELVPAAAVETAWADIVGVVRTRLLAIPAKIAPRVAVSRDAGQAQEVIEGEINAALVELSGMRADLQPSEADGDHQPDAGGA